MKTLTLIVLAMAAGFKAKTMEGSFFRQMQSQTSGKEAKSSLGDSGKTNQTSQAKTKKQEQRSYPFTILAELKGFDPDQTKKMRKALILLEKTVRSEKFKQKVLAHTYKGSKTYYRHRGMSNEQIYAAILKGAEVLNPVEDGVMNLSMTLYHSQTNTVGYTYPDTNQIWVNTKYFDRYTLAEVANNAMHEWLHKIGFEHSFYNNDDRPFTVPYAIGEIVEEIFNEEGY